MPTKDYFKSRFVKKKTNQNPNNYQNRKKKKGKKNSIKMKYHSVFIQTFNS